MNVMAPHAPTASRTAMANAIRFLAMDAVEKAKSGHPGMPMGMADVATVLFTKFLKFDPAAAHWPDRDRFVLSAGHGSMLLPRSSCRGSRSDRAARRSEVSRAMEAAKTLRSEGKRVAVVSMPCWDLFERQTEDYRRTILGSAPRIAIEAGARLGWDRWIGERGLFIGMNGFGASAPAPDLYRHFGITADAVVEAKSLVN